MRKAVPLPPAFLLVLGLSFLVSCGTGDDAQDEFKLDAFVLETESDGGGGVTGECPVLEPAAGSACPLEQNPTVKCSYVTGTCEAGKYLYRDHYCCFLGTWRANCPPPDEPPNKCINPEPLRTDAGVAVEAGAAVDARATEDAANGDAAAGDGGVSDASGSPPA